MLVSTHRDGEIIVNAVAGFGVDFIRGSAANEKKADKDKQGASAVAQMIGALDAGDAVGVTPDGPRGPAMSVQAGIVRLAAMTEAPILGFACVASRRRELSTWDRFQLALPFSSVYVVVSPPVRLGAIESHSDVADAKARIKAALDDAAAEATGRAGGRFASEAKAAATEAAAS